MFHHPEEAARDLVLACIPTTPRNIPPEHGEHPIVATAAAFRAVLEETAQALIDLIDDLDGDPDHEPSLGWNCEGYGNETDDREDDAGDSREDDHADKFGIADLDGMREQGFLGWGGLVE